MAVLVASTATVAIVSATSSSGWQGDLRNAYRPLPKALRVNGQLMFTRLDSSEIARVRLSPEEAVQIVKDDDGAKEPWRVVFESLGGYVNDLEIIHDWVGTKSLIPKPLPAYIVRITGVPIYSLGPNPIPAVNHYWNVIVNAITGHVIGSFTYD
jgi:hypothetical protein